MNELHYCNSIGKDLVASRIGNTVHPQEDT
jgi:hypothetical protein